MTRSEILQTAKPIRFSTEMVRAIQDGRKTVTRRVVKPKYTNTKIILQNGKVFETAGTPTTTAAIKFPYQVGDILYVRETWNYIPETENDGFFIYAADGHRDIFRWHPSIHMPKEAARVFLRVTRVRVERLRDITDEQAISEGFTSRSEFISEFLKIYPSCTEDSFVWVIEFEMLEVE